jgi:hypothetical protein
VLVAACDQGGGSERVHAAPKHRPLTAHERERDPPPSHRPLTADARGHQSRASVPSYEQQWTRASSSTAAQSQPQSQAPSSLVAVSLTAEKMTSILSYLDEAEAQVGGYAYALGASA